MLNHKNQEITAKKTKNVNEYQMIDIYINDIYQTNIFVLGKFDFAEYLLTYDMVNSKEQIDALWLSI